MILWRKQASPEWLAANESQLELIAGRDLANPSAAIHAWPMQHPVAASLLWSVALLVIFAPLATLLYRRRTTG